MGKVNIDELEKAQAKADKLASKQNIEEKFIGSEKYFKGPVLEQWFDDYGECLQANSNEARKQDNLSRGLDADGRSEAQVKLAEAKRDLLAKKAGLIEKAKQIDKEIANLRAEAFVEEKKSTKKKK